jgi:hypothetical protein
MSHVRRVLVIVGAVLGRSWGAVRTAFASGSRRASAGLVQMNSVRRRYALGAASREQLETAVRTVRPPARPARRGAQKRRRKKAA